MRWRQVAVKIAMLVSIVHPVVLHAQIYTCTGSVAGATLDPAGRVYAESLAGLSHTYVCQLGSYSNGVAPDACKAIYAMLVTAQLAQKNVTLWFNDGGSCTSHPAWSALSGWYFGPILER